MKAKGWVILAIVILALVFIGFQAKMIYDRISFDFGKAFRGINLGSFNVADLITNGQTQINANLGLDIVNDNAFSIPFKDLKATFYFNDTVIADTSSELTNKHFTVPANGKLTVSDSVNIYLNKAGLDILKQKLTKQHPNLRWTLKVKIGILNIIWIPVTYEDTFTW